MSVPTPITQRDVATACRLHPSTVCLALKNSPSIPLSTRQRVQATALELGYTPNVAARNLALLRTDKKPAGLLPIAWVNQERQRDYWRADPQGRLCFDAARRRAQELGYHLEEVWTREPGMSPARLMQILRARGIEGVLFPAQRTFDFSLLNRGWDEFSLVGFNDYRLSEWLDVVCPDYYRNTDVALTALRRLGFASPGLLLTAQFDAATRGLVRSCFLRHQVDGFEPNRVPVCVVPDDASAANPLIADWLEEHQPDAVLCHDDVGVEQLRGSRNLSSVSLQGGGDGHDGAIDPGSGDVAAMAVDCVVEKIRRFDKGRRESTRVHTLTGTWHGGRLAARELHTVVA